MSTNIDIGAKIRQLRLERSMTQEQLAQRLNLSAQAISKWENGATMPDIQLLPELSALLGATIDELFSMTDDTRFDRVENMLEDVRFIPDAEFERTERWLKQAREDAGKRPRATLLLAQLYNKRADEYHELASPLAREALALSPECKDAHNAVFDAERGVCADWCLANHRRLIDFYKGVVAAHPEDRRNYYWLLDLLVADKRLEEARAYVEQLRAVADTWHCELYQGQICLAACDLPGALDCFRRMTEREPENWLTWAAYADEMARLCRYDEALAYQQKAAALREKPRFVDCEETMTQLHELKGDYAAAIEDQRRIIAILREDWSVTEGESVDMRLREIERLRALESGERGVDAPQRKECAG